MSTSSGSGTVLGTTAVVPSTAAVAVLPHTGTYRAIFVIASVTLAVGAIVLVASAVAAFFKRATAA